MIGIVAIVVVIVLVIATLAAIGAFSSKRSSGPSTYSQAASDTASYLSSYRGGGWHPLFAEGIYTSMTETSTPLNTSAIGVEASLEGCTSTVVVANGTTITLNGESATLSSGRAAGWIFAEVNDSGGIALVQEIGGSVSMDFLLDCPTLGAELTLIPPIPSSVIDSSTAIQAVLAQPGAGAFLAAHSNLSAVFGLGPTSILSLSGDEEWNITIQACSVGSTSSAEVATFSGTVGAINGTVLSAQAGRSSCGGSIVSIPSSVVPPTSIALGTVLTFGMSSQSPSDTNATGGAPVCSVTEPCTNYTVPIAAGGSGLAWYAVDLVIDTPDGVTITGASNWTWNVLSAAGGSVATATGGLETFWEVNGGGDLAVSAGQTLVLTVPEGIILSGDSVVATGTGDF
ncbi:MAG: hypothetical protein ACRECR_01225, partial [Thermoplasmata archaeon]